jgi:hypothetical protein
MLFFINESVNVVIVNNFMYHHEDHGLFKRFMDHQGRRFASLPTIRDWIYATGLVF